MRCSFCSRDIEKGTGTNLFLNTGKIFSFCSSKCEKNHNLGRDPRNFKWVKKQ